MAVIYISITLFIIMLLFPILFSLFFLRKKGDGVLRIEQSKMKDPRYFAKSFARLFDDKWANYDGSGKVFLSREEKILQGDRMTEYPYVCNSIVYVENKDFRPYGGIRFEKEVYACQNAYLDDIEIIRAICCKRDMVLGSGTKVLRWADAEGTLTALDDCDLGISTSSASRLIIGSNCSFRRLYAPVILFGQAPPEEPQLTDYNKNGEIESFVFKRFRNIRYIDDDIVDDTGALDGSVITIHAVSVLNGLVVKGHIRSYKSIRLCDNSVVYGNLFAEEDIYLGQNSHVYGSVFTQGNLYAESGAVIGQPGRIKSVIARGSIIFEKNCCVFGYVSTEAGGKSNPDSSKRGETNSRFQPHSYHEESYLQKKLLPAAISVVMLFIIISGSLSASVILQKVKSKEKLQMSRQTTSNGMVYGVDGKPGGGKLETEPTLVTNDYVYFNDRVLERFHYDANNTLQCSKAISSIMSSLPKSVNKYLMLVPMRINIEGERYSPYTDDVNAAIAEIYARMPSEVTTLDAADALLEHRDKYLFFRTDPGWTALGAYYAGKEFCKSAGINIKDVKEYRESRLDGYIGTMRKLPHAQSLNNYADYVSYYILDGAANEQIITTRQAEDEYITYKSPAVAVSRRGDDIYIGSYFSHSILQGDAKNGRTLIILGDEYGKTMAPWLTPYYEKVILINTKYFSGGSEKFWQLFSQYKVTDLLTVESVQNLGNSITNNKIMKISLKP